MADRARVTSIDEMKGFREALIRFGEEGRMALAAVTAEMRRTIDWVEFDQRSHWQRELKRRTNALAAARIEVQRQELAGKRAIDERRALTRAKQDLEEAQAKVKIVQRWRRLLARDLDLHTGALKQLETSLLQNIPEAAATIDRAVENLERYLRLAPPTMGDAPAGGKPPAPMNVISREEAASQPPAKSDSTVIDAFCARAVAARPSRSSASMTSPLALNELLAAQARNAEMDSQSVAGDAITNLDEEQSSTSWSGQRIIVEPGALAADEILAVRDESADALDSGWYMGLPSSSEVDTRTLTAVLVGDLVRLRPALLEVIQLPPGHIVTVREGRIVEIIVRSLPLAIATTDSISDEASQPNTEERSK